MYNEKKIILFFPDPKLEGLTWHRMPFSVLAVSSLLVNNGYNVRIFDERFEKNLEKDITIAASDALCVGLSCFTGNQISGALKIARLIRENNPVVPLVWGGWHPSLFPQQTIKDPNVDIVVCGQGERTFFELAEAMSNNGSIDKIGGIFYKIDGKIFTTHPRPLEDINNFPSLPLDLIDVRNYIGPHPGLEGAMTLSYISSQGCPYRCGFCADKKVYQRRWFGLSTQRVIGDIAKLVNAYKLQAIYFEDNNFFVNKNRVEEISRGIIANKLNIKWEAMGHPRQLSHLDDGFWTMLRQAGCRRILIGAESGEQEILDLINKDATVEDTINFVRKAQKHNITPILSTLAGFPKSAIKDLRKTVKLVVGIKRWYSKTEWKLFIYTPYPGTDLYNMALEYGMKEPQDLLGWSRHTLRDVKTPWIDEKFRALIRHIAFFYVQVAYPTKYVTAKVNQYKYKIFITPIFKIVQFIARLRLFFNCYLFPVEPIIYAFLTKRWKKSI